ncbi:MAG: TolC family protein [Myxococcota bacterium]|nr:TolC family protein [Myxococcota bacterium]
MCIFYIAFTWADSTESISGIVQEVWERHPSVQAAKMQQQQQNQFLSATEVWKEPSLSLSVAPLGAGYAVSVNQPFLYRKEVSLQRQRADIYIRESDRLLQEQKEELQRSLIFHVADWMYAKRKLALSIRHQELIEAHKKSVQGRVEIGAIPKAVLIQLESELADLSVLRIGYMTEVQKHQIRIEELLGRPLSSEIDLEIPPPLSIKNQSAAFLAKPQLDKELSRVQSDLHHIEKRPPLFFSMGHSNMMMDENKWWTVGMGMRIPTNQNTKQALIEYEFWKTKKIEMQEQALREDWRSQVRVEEQVTKGLLQQREILEQQTKPAVERECATMGVAFEAGQVSIDSVLKAEHKRVRILDHDAQIIKKLWYSYANQLFLHGLAIEAEKP